jgi:predicted nucleotidyltransferase
MAVAQKYGATDIKIFGSVARGEERDDSDVDILVSMPRGYDMFQQRLPLKEELETIVGRKVDLIVKHEINKYLQEIILQEAKDL